MDKLLVIGASGMLGSRIMDIGASRYEEYGTYKEHKLNGKNMHMLDVNKREDAFELVNKIKPDLIVDTHALHNVDYCELHKEEAWGANVDGTRNVAEAAKIVGAKYVYISTDYVFDGKKLDYTEKDKPNPLNYYAKTKLVGEHILSILDINYLIIRTAVIYGNGGSGKVPFPIWLADKLMKGEKVNVVVDQHNNPTFADSIADSIFKLHKADMTGLFHVTGSDCMSRYDFAISIAKAFNLDKSLISPITTPQLNQVALRPEKVKMDTGKVEKAINTRMIGVEEGLRLFKEQVGK